jgi:hypothetical protein
MTRRGLANKFAAEIDFRQKMRWTGFPGPPTVAAMNPAGRQTNLAEPAVGRALHDSQTNSSI